MSMGQPADLREHGSGDQPRGQSSASGNTRGEKGRALARMQRALIALFVSFLWLRSTASAFWTEENRLFFFWQRSDTIAVFLAIGLVAGVFYVAYLLSRRCGRIGVWLFELFFVATTAFYLKVNLSETLEQYAIHGTRLDLLLKGLVVAAVVVFLALRRRTVRFLRATCLILSPILLVYLIRLALASPVESSHLPSESPGEAGRPVMAPQTRICLVVFDEWSYRRTFENGRPREEFGNLAKLAEHSVVFQHAASPDTQTLNSLPSLICGVKVMAVAGTAGFKFDAGTGATEADAYPTVFQEMKRRGYSTLLVGNYLPYASIFRAGLDRCEAYNIYKVLGAGPLEVCASLLAENTRIRLSSFRLARLPFVHAKRRYFNWLALRMRSRILDGLKSSEPSFMLFHHSVPHPPFIFDSNGLKPLAVAEGSSPLANYEGNLRFVDRLIGEMVAVVERSSPSDRTVLILTSDHSFRFDPSPSAAESVRTDLRHVPLIVHFSGQTNRVDVNAPFQTVCLKNVLLKWLDTDLSEEAFVKVCGKCEEETPTNAPLSYSDSNRLH